MASPLKVENETKCRMCVKLINTYIEEDQKEQNKITNNSFEFYSKPNFGVIKKWDPNKKLYSRVQRKNELIFKFYVVFTRINNREF